MSDFDYNPTTVSRMMSRVRSDLHGPDHAATAAAKVPDDGRTLDEAIAHAPVYNPPLAIDIQGRTIVLGDGGGAAGAAPLAPRAPTTASLHEGAVRSEIGRVSAQLGDPHLPQDDPSRPPLSELLNLLQGADAILRAGMQLAPETVARIEELRAATPVRSLTDYKDPELRSALASTRLERDRAAGSNAGKAVLLQQRLTALEREGERRWGDAEPCLDARATLVPASQLPRGSYSPEALLSCSGPAGACASVDQVARIEAKRQEECAWTGVDPLRFADVATGEPTADVENGAAKAEANVQKWLEIIASETQNPLAAMTVLGSVATGSSVDVTADRVQFADAAAGVLGAMGAAAWHRATTEPPPVRGMRRPTPGPGLGPRVRATGQEPLARVPSTKGVVLEERLGPQLGARAHALERSPSSTRGALPRDPVERARFAASQLTPSGKAWWDPSLTFEEFALQYKTGGGTLPRERLEAEYNAGKRLNPETGKLKAVVGTATYATAPDTLAAVDVPSTEATAYVDANGRTVTIAELQRTVDAHAKECRGAQARLDTLRDSGASADEVEGARTVVKNASRDLGEAGAELYVAVRYAGPPPPQLVYPPPGAGSRSGDFDRVFRVADRHGHTRIVVEAKGNTAELGDRKVDAAGVRDAGKADQGTSSYLVKVASVMSESRDPAMKRTGKEILSAINSKQIDYIQVRTTSEPGVPIEGREFDLASETGVRRR